MTHPNPVDRDTIERALEDSSLRKREREWVLHRIDSVEGLEQSVDLWHKRYMDANEPTIDRFACWRYGPLVFSLLAITFVIGLVAVTVWAMGAA